MKIIKLSNQFEDEGRDTLELIDERERYESEQELKKQEIKKRYQPTHSFDIASLINRSETSEGERIFENMLSLNYTPSGVEGVFLYKDDRRYKVTIEPLD